jgi:hypothetical protein
MGIKLFIFYMMGLNEGEGEHYVHISLSPMKEPCIGSWLTLRSGADLVVGRVGEKLLLLPGIKPLSSSHITNCLDHLIFVKFAWKCKLK